MARQRHKLSPLKVAREKVPGKYPDGGGLYLIVGKTGAKNWVFRYALDGREHQMGLGAVSDVSLADARRKAQEARELKDKEVDPIEYKANQRAAKALEKASHFTFEEAADAYICSQKAGWDNLKHSLQWASTLKTYAYPTIGAVPVKDIDARSIQSVLQPIWANKTETASRLRGRIERVLDWATTSGYRAGENPARWRGQMSNLLPKPSKVRKVQHHPALPYREIGDFVARLREQTGTAARVLEFLILTAVRTSEAIEAEWKEINLEAKTWTIPANRIKARREHRIPLSKPAISILEELQRARKILKGGDPSPFVFSHKPGASLSSGALLGLLKRMERPDITAHGFRSTFRDWAAEVSSFPREVAEMALAHVIEDKTEAAYRRGDLFEKRRKMMEEWAVYVGTLPESNVAAIPKAQNA